MEICSIAKSQLFVPGAYVVTKGATIHFTWLALKPSLSATAYATALSNPFPVFGSLSFHCEPFVVPPSK